MERKSRIIAVSGMPLSGKSTVINKMEEKLKNEGIKEENIHIISVGKKFREYFNKMMDLVNNINNKEALKELSQDKDIKRIFENSEYRKEIQKAIVELNKSGFNVENFDIEKANNNEKLAHMREIIDEIVDTEVKDIGKKAIEQKNPNEVWIIDSRLAFSNIPESFSIRLTVKDDVAANRLFNDTRKRGKEDNNYSNIEVAKEKVIKRKNGEEKRYKERYGVDLSDEENYNLIIDTSFSDIEEIAQTILKGEEYYRNDYYYEKRWASPKVFLPLQSERDTCYKGFGGYTIDDMIEAIKKDGFDPTCAIEVIQSKGRYYIIEGYHRNFASAYIGKTLVPYEVVSMPEKDKEARVKYLNESKLYGHEWFFDKYDDEERRNRIETFSYNEVYPGIIDELKNKRKQDDEWIYD